MHNTDLDVYRRKQVVGEFAGFALREIRGDDMRAVHMRVTRQALQA